MTIVTPSKWLESLVLNSFLGVYETIVIHNKVNLEIFKPTICNFRIQHNLEGKRIVLGVANVWNTAKGFDDFIKLSEIMDETFSFVMVGLTREKLKVIPDRIIGIQQTHSEDELASIYSAADVFVNLTYQDTFPTVNLEAIACGTPVVSYITGGSCEAFDVNSGIAVAQGDIEGVKRAVGLCLDLNKNLILERAAAFSAFGDYSRLYSM